MKQATKRRLWTSVMMMGASLLAAQPASAGWLAGATIDRIQVTPTGNVVLYVTSAHECGGTRLEYDVTATAATKMVYAGLLAAQAQNRTMNIMISSCVGQVGIFTHIEG